MMIRRALRQPCAFAFKDVGFPRKISNTQSYSTVPVVPTTSKPKPKIAVSVVLFHVPTMIPDDKKSGHQGEDLSVLLIKRGNPPAQGLWSLPGGKMEHGETIFECGVRELWEETGIRENSVELAKNPFTVAEFVNSEYHYIILELFGIIRSREVRSIDLRSGDDASGIGWCPVSLFDHHCRHLLPREGVVDATYHDFPFVDPESASMEGAPVVPQLLANERYNGSILPVINLARKMFHAGLFEFDAKKPIQDT